MKLIITKNSEEIGKEAVAIVRARLLEKADLVLGLATGSTPLPLYREMIRLHKEEGISFAQVRTFNLDEYLGLTPEHPQSYHHFMTENLFHGLDIPKENIHLPDGLTKDPEKFCVEYEDAIEKVGGIDLQVVGIGGDGHIAFNEPGSSLASRTRVKTLDERTIQDNSRFFSKIDEVPRFALTMGVGTIMEAKEILFLANGKGKADIVAQAIEGPVTSLVTASILQIHPRVTAILDEDAAGGLKRKDYYKYAQEQARRFEKA